MERKRNKQARHVFVAGVCVLLASAALADDFGTGGNEFTIDFVTISGSTNPGSEPGIVNNDFRIWQGRRTYDQGEQIQLGSNSSGGVSCCMYVVLVGERGPQVDQTPPVPPAGVVVNR